MHQDLLLQVAVAVVDRCGRHKVYLGRAEQAAQVVAVLGQILLLQALLRQQVKLIPEAGAGVEMVAALAR
jgi:hypothetical protein